MIDVAVLGATGTVGQRFIQLLEAHPYFRVAEVAASERSVRRPYAEASRWLLSTPMPERIGNLVVLPLDAQFRSPLIMSALPGEVAKTLEFELAARGHVVSSNTSANRMVEDVPLLLPEINAEHIGLIDVQRRRRGWSSGALVTMTNCTTVPMVVAMAALKDFNIEAVQVVSMQAISGAGHPGVASLDILDNVVPYIGSEEDKLETEPSKILGRLDPQGIHPYAAKISASCNRVPVLDGHLVSVSIKFCKAPPLDEVKAALVAFEGSPLARNLPSAPQPVIQYLDAPDRPQPRLDRDAGRGMTTSVGRLRPCNVLDIKFSALSHNTIRGAAGGAIFNAELLAAHGYLHGVDVSAAMPSARA
ncbi:MAG: aspartate-semialdehyde dehydrogenase [Anaerolineae bacterium]